MPIQPTLSVEDVDNDIHLGVVTHLAEIPEPLWGWMVTDPQNYVRSESGRAPSREAAEQAAEEQARRYGVNGRIGFVECGI